MTRGKSFSKMFFRQGYPDFLDLPWNRPLVNWPEICERVIEVERGPSRHEVVFVSYEHSIYGTGRIYAVKELPARVGEKEYRILRELEKLDMPSVKPVGYAERTNTWKTKEAQSIVITEYLESSLPYLSLFTKTGLERYQERLLDALAVLLVRLHLNGFFWGDCSLANVLFRRDAGELQAYLVDAETSKHYPSLSSGQRNHDLLIMEENIAGELFDLSSVVNLPESLDIYEVGLNIRQKYEQLWEEITRDEIFDSSENYRIQERIRRLNELGFSVDEVELVATGEGSQLKMRMIVTDRNYHQELVHKLTGIATEEIQAQQMVHEIYGIKAKLSEEEQTSISLSNAAFYWAYEVYIPTIKELGLMYNSTAAPAIYCEVLEHKWYLSEAAGRDIHLATAVKDYKEKILSKRGIDLFNSLLGKQRVASPVRNGKIRATLSEEWKKAVIYQIYPRSFLDTDSDGIGDLKGIISKLEYLKWLGIDVLRLSPVYSSPMADFGYDVSDYTGIHQLFGTLDNFDELISRVHELGLKIILDYIPNHSSDQHPWFIESRSSRDNPKRDWYIWLDSKEDGSPPNNWLCVTGGSAWSLDQQTDQYYLHSFLPSQPDLNWRHPEVRKAMLDVLRFWLDRGVDGINPSMIRWLAKDKQFRDDPLNPSYDAKVDLPYQQLNHIYSTDQPELYDYIKEIYRVVKEYPERVIIGEANIFDPIDSILKYFESGLIHIPANPGLLFLPWKVSILKEYIDIYDKSLPPHTWSNYQLSNHDHSRTASRIGKEQARVAAMLLLTLRGLPIIYYGEEIGMHDVPVLPELIQDPWGLIQPGKSRDPERTPMQWNADPNAGFSNVTPWLPVANNYRETNVEIEKNDPHSFVSLYRKLIQLRRDNLSLSLGNYTLENDVPADCYVYHRQYQGKHHLIALNFSAEERTVSLPGLKDGKLILSTFLDREELMNKDSITLRGNEGCLIDVSTYR
ncbi:MAG: DUF4032 domain-containing protein [Candidatus Odinarchaeota archaeon]